MEAFKNLLRVQRNGGGQEQSVALRILEEVLPLHQSLRSAQNTKNQNEGLERGAGVIKCSNKYRQGIMNQFVLVTLDRVRK